MKAARFTERYGPYALVAGGSVGLGAAFADALARRVLNLVLVARQEDRLKATAVRLTQTYGVDVVSVAADMADMADAKRRIGALEDEHDLTALKAARAEGGAIPWDSVKADHAWRVRTGDYRILYEITDRTLRVWVITVGRRRDIYR